MKELSIEEKAKRYDEAKYIMEEYLKSGNAGVIAENTIKHAFPELREESEDERIRQALIRFHKSTIDVDGIKGAEIVSWLEKQGEHAKFRDSIQVGDKVTRNKDGVLVNLSQLNRVAKKDEKQGEQKLAKWSEEDKKELGRVIYMMEQLDLTESWSDCYTFLNSLKDRVQPQNTWKPSEEMLEALYRAVPENVMEISEDEMLLDKLYQGLKYGKVLSKK